jgi:hypothetical protein
MNQEDRAVLTLFADRVRERFPDAQVWTERRDVHKNIKDRVFCRRARIVAGSGIQVCLGDDPRTSTSLPYQGGEDWLG